MYKKPDWFTTHLVNPLLKGLHRLGIGVAGSQTLAVRGRKSGELRTNPVNPFELDGRTYLLAPRGTTQWVRNLRAAGGQGELHLGRRVEPFRATELGDDAKPDVLRAYLKRWKMEIGVFFNGVGPDASDGRLREIAPGYPVFQIERAG